MTPPPGQVGGGWVAVYARMYHDVFVALIIHLLRMRRSEGRLLSPSTAPSLTPGSLDASCPLLNDTRLSFILKHSDNGNAESHARKPVIISYAATIP
jgi:hypothetical protein